MLILTRKPSETLIIGDDIKVTVLNIQGNQVRIGIDAPSHISVHREEIYKRIQDENNTSNVTEWTVPEEPITSNDKVVTVLVKKNRKLA